MPTAVLQHAVTELKGVGPKLAERLARCGIFTVEDLLFHLPYRYQDRTRITPIRDCRPGDYAVIEGVTEAVSMKFGRKPSLTCKIRDESGEIGLRLFHFNQSQKQQFSAGVRIRCFGEVRLVFNGKEMIHPEYRVIQEDSITPVEENLTPIYSTTAGLQQRSLRNLTETALQYLQNDDCLTEYLPAEIRSRMNLATLRDAISFVHRPPPDTKTHLLEAAKHPCQQRLAFEELLAQRLAMRQVRHDVQQIRAPAMPGNQAIITDYLGRLPFTLTGAQQRVFAEISRDLILTKPMLRLVQGDVGSGKTVVATLAALQAISSGYQAALMAPTEILAEQHYQNIKQYLEPMGVEVAWLAGKLKTSQRREMLQAIASGSARLAVGTHALFQKEVMFENLGLVIIDEQHRFGVHQRLALKEKGESDGMLPHQLIMTATPIPRTLAMTAYADLETSLIDELPPGRTPIQTLVLANSRRQQVIERIQNIVDAGRQAYWVCTLIEESEALQCEAAEDTTERLREALPNVRIGLVHGRMKSDEKEAIMQAFKAKALDLLVATTVIEVGVDVPNATLMVIENAERLGLAQLHQLRGRVGRGANASFCVLLYQSPLSRDAKARLQVMRETTDGFVIARKDLEIRGPGELLGTRQTGIAQLRIADIIRDDYMLEKVQEIADEIEQIHPDIISPLIKRWLPGADKYASV